MTPWPWQLRIVILAVVVIPPSVGILASIAPEHFADGLHFPRWESITSFVITTVFITVPMSYLLGAIPAAIGAGLYCLVLTKVPSIANSPLRRSALATFFGTLLATCSVYYIFGAGGGAIYYGLITGCAGAVFAVRWPRLTIAGANA